MARAIAFACLAAAATAQTCTPTTSLYGPASGNPKRIDGAPLNFADFAGNVTLFTNVASF